MQENPVLEIARNLPGRGCAPEEAQRYTRWLATHHYENFTVVSWLLPRRLHQHFYNVYAYCRWADDLGDEVPDPKTALKLLDAWDEELAQTYAGHPSHPVFVALSQTVTAMDIPIEPFRDLLIAFRQDQTVHRYADWDDVLDYCRYSANPVGRLVLYLMRLSRCRTPVALRCHLHRAAAREFLAGCCARSRKGPHLYSARFARGEGPHSRKIFSRAILTSATCA